MKDSNLLKAALCASVLLVPSLSQAAPLTVGPGGFDDGWATTITYEADNTIARRGTANNRDNPLNALGSSDGSFFELGFGSSADFTFGTRFDTSVSVFEITFGSVPGWPESVEVLAGDGGTFTLVGVLTNSAAQGGGALSLAGLGTFDTIRLVDGSPLSSTGQSDGLGALGGFDVDAVRISPVPIPAAMWLFGSALIGVMAIARRKRAQAVIAA